jgi:mutator protein MutT
VDIAVGELFEEIAHDYPEKSVHLKFFLCQLLAGEPQPLDCAAVKWIEKPELKTHAFPAADARLLEKLARRDFPGFAF